MHNTDMTTHLTKSSDLNVGDQYIRNGLTLTITAIEQSKHQLLNIEVMFNVTFTGGYKEDPSKEASRLFLPNQEVERVIGE